MHRFIHLRAEDSCVVGSSVNQFVIEKFSLSRGCKGTHLLNIGRTEDPAMDTSVDPTVSPTEMEETLQKLFDVVNKLEEQPGNVPLLRKNVDLAKKVQMMQEAAGGLEILANTVGCPKCEQKAVGWLQQASIHLADVHLSMI